MSVNPSGGRSNDSWLGGAQGSNPGAQRLLASSSNLGAHGVTTSTSKPQVEGRAQRIWSQVKQFFQGKTSTSSSSQSVGGSTRPMRPPPPPPPTGGARSRTPATHGKGQAPQPPRGQSRRPPPPPPPTGGARSRTPATHGKGQAPQPPTGQSRRPLPPPPSTGGVRSRTPATHSKGQAPQPPTGQSRRPLPPPPSTGGARSRTPVVTHGKGQAPQPPTQQQSPSMSPGLVNLVQGLKEAVKSQAESKQTQLANVSSTIRSNWTNWESNENPNYITHGYRVVLGALEQTYKEQSGGIEGTGGSAPLPQAVGLAKEAVTRAVRSAVKNLERPGPGNPPDGVFMQALVSLTLEGPTLASGESIENFLESRIGDFGRDDSNTDYTNDVSSLGKALDRVRQNHPGEMPRVWMALVRELTPAVRSHANSVRVENAGQVQTRAAVQMTNTSNRLLTAMKDLSLGGWATTMTILIGDLFDE
ncbi:SemD/SinC family type III secretion system effector [Candidatus Chlamydia corallus]|uniref:SemD/SinC family type III secretion system effector n=1 Tax=Candidatus Chlamydia corallus TaxID=2038470 RepID=UPI000C2FD566|nr:hypothetical protein [Candidatus Chlamydia corallus]